MYFRPRGDSNPVPLTRIRCEVVGENLWGIHVLDQGYIKHDEIIFTIYLIRKLHLDISLIKGIICNSRRYAWNYEYK